MKGKRQEKILEIIRTNDIETTGRTDQKIVKKQDFLRRRGRFQGIFVN